MTRVFARAWPPSRIGVRLLAFNLLVMFVPVIGVLYLDVYETQLLQAQEREMVQQGRMLAAAAAAERELVAAHINAILTRLERQTEARFRVYDANGTLIADSAALSTADLPPASEYSQGSPDVRSTQVRDRVLYRLGAWLAGVRQRIGGLARHLLRPDTKRSEAPAAGSGLLPEVRAALDGRYGAATRHTQGQRSLTLYSALPIRTDGSVTGAVLVSQSTFRVLQAIYDVRLRIFQVVVASIFAAAALTTLSAMTIVRPLRRLRRTATALTARRGPLPSSFPGATRKDELGDLARALEELARRVNDQIALLEGFAADVSHEFKNPLASIRTAAEMIGQAERPEDRDRFLHMMLRDVDRLERLVSGAREMARIDGELEHSSQDVVAIREVLLEMAAIPDPGASVRLHASIPEQAVVVRGNRERLVQVFDNLLSNARSFAPAGSTIELSARATGTDYVVSIADRGPGIPDAHLDQIFERFFTYRPTSGRRDHVGLGLSIARRIVEGSGGSIVARNREGGGAVFEVRLPAVPTHSRTLVNAE